MMDNVLVLITSPGGIFILGGLLAGLAPAGARRIVLLATVMVSAYALYHLGHGLDYDETRIFGSASIFGFDLTFVRIDKLSLIFAAVFHIAAALNIVYGWHVRDRMECAMALIYPGAALGGVLAGDLLTLFVFWELAATSSVFLVWTTHTEAAFKAGMRYLVIQVGSGVALLGGVAVIAHESGSLDFTAATLHGGGEGLSVAALLIFIAFGIKSAFPLLHNWVQDSYPKSSVSGTIILSIFTTKLAVYALARGFAGMEALIWIGAVMTIFPIFFALIENDLRKVLTYSINNQVGFMVVGIGIGTELSINGAVGYAFTNIIFESLLFMAVGAALYRTGTSKATELGGLYRTMPITAIYCIIGALSISAFPLFSGFVTKGMIIQGVGEAQMLVIWLILLFASAGVLEHAGIKIPYFTFFAHDSGKRPREAPPAMLAAMTVSAVLSIAIGVEPIMAGLGLGPHWFYGILPFEVTEYHAYSGYHIVEQLQLLLFAILAFALLVKFKLYPPEVPSTNLDTDWFYRVPGRLFTVWAYRAIGATWNAAWRMIIGRTRRMISEVHRFHGPEGQLARSWPIGFMALWTAVVLGVALLVSYL